MDAPTCAPAPRRHLPEGTLVAFTGGKDFDDVTAIWRLDSIQVRRHAAARRRTRRGEDRGKLGVHQRLQAELGPRRQGRALRRNGLLNFLPKGLVAFPGSGITNNMIDKARKIGIPVLLAAA